MCISTSMLQKKKVDWMEGHVMINPSHVPLQWLRVFTSLSSATLDMHNAFQQEIHYLTKCIERLIHLRVQNRFVQLSTVI